MCDQMASGIDPHAGCTTACSIKNLYDSVSALERPVTTHLITYILQHKLFSNEHNAMQGRPSGDKND